MSKHRPSKAALPRGRSAAARALERPEHRQRIIPDKRGKVEREQHRRDMKHRHTKITRVETEPDGSARPHVIHNPRERIEAAGKHLSQGNVKAAQRALSKAIDYLGCNHDNTGEYNCDHQPCILCLGPWNRNR